MLVRIFRHFVPVSVIVLALTEITLISIVWHWYLSANPSFSVLPRTFFQSSTLPLALVASLAMLISGMYQNRTFINHRILAAHMILDLVILLPIFGVIYVYWNELLEQHNYLWELYF